MNEQNDDPAYLAKVDTMSTELTIIASRILDVSSAAGLGVWQTIVLAATLLTFWEAISR